MSLEHEPIRGKLAYSIPEFCEIAGIGRTTVYGEMAAGRLRVKKVGTRSLITAESGRAWLDALPDFKPNHHADPQSEVA